jgi:dolichyl-phosphate beta-glucosyltransferase
MSPSSVQRATIVVPCFNEELRLQPDGFREFLAHPHISLLFVDDGSTDRTRETLEALCRTLQGRARLLAMPRNGGKAAAVRAGLQAALVDRADIVGYFDADLATPPEEMARLVRVLTDGGFEVALAARVALLGTRIERRALRHYLGRVFATCASLVLSLRVYDTQCGAKAFRSNHLLSEVLSEPFVARWAFDVELLGRMLAGTRGFTGLSPDRFVEMPLTEWRDVAGSKIRWRDFPRMGIELVRIWSHLAARRRAIAHSRRAASA